ncbi:DUF6146 family protein [Thermophagus sp. OGC60D27]|uniref:DUF6146 family protein n=1 Tax=Thermophagus sp. OGC60D27 TaxID=3458415 RepID=UPI0040376B2A
MNSTMKQNTKHWWKLAFIPVMLSGIIFFSCSSTKKLEGPLPKVKFEKNNITQSEDSVEYELIVLDPGFESWLISQPPANYYSQQYYENWNQRYVTEWNHRHSSPLRYGSFYETAIDYDPSVDYGLELNYRLYSYFRFIEHEYGIVLIPRGR